jgi:hypothetical protein
MSYDPPPIDPEVVAQARRELEARGVLGPAPVRQERSRGRGITRSSLEAYKLNFQQEYQLKDGEFVIEDLAPPASPSGTSN